MQTSFADTKSYGRMATPPGIPRPAGKMTRSAEKSQANVTTQTGQNLEDCASLLRILSDSFNQSFDILTDPSVVVNLCSQIVKGDGTISSCYIAGKMTALCIRQPSGKCMYTIPQGAVDIDVLGREDLDGYINKNQYNWFSRENSPSFLITVPVKADKSGIVSQVRVVASLVGFHISMCEDSFDHWLERYYTDVSDPPTPEECPTPDSMPDELHTTFGAEPMQRLRVRWLFELQGGVEDVSDPTAAAPTAISDSSMMDQLEEMLRQTLSLAG
ncbi:hypothetical protein F4780DRAFT_700241 [Xylariomycetidae sp. FL0641]|nr:hypothetical protein F4780DRAFT_700241 [Xylariomycetidae sp. FL0641]